MACALYMFMYNNVCEYLESAESDKILYRVMLTMPTKVPVQNSDNDESIPIYMYVYM